MASFEPLQKIQHDVVRGKHNKDARPYTPVKQENPFVIIQSSIPEEPLWHVYAVNKMNRCSLGKVDAGPNRDKHTLTTIIILLSDPIHIIG